MGDNPCSMISISETQSGLNSNFISGRKLHVMRTCLPASPLSLLLSYIKHAIHLTIEKKPRR